MAYTKTNWVNGTTPLNDTNMNKIENALENLDTNISKSTDEYSSTRTYSIGELVIYNNKLYKANQDITTAEAFNSSHWTEVTLLSDVNEIKSVVNNNADNLNKMDEEIANAVEKSDLLNLIYPVGSIYMSVNSTNPATLFGGTWEEIKGRFLLAHDDSHPAASTGGEYQHTLTEAEMPEHAHAEKANNSYSNPHDLSSLIDSSNSGKSSGFTFDINQFVGWTDEVNSKTGVTHIKGIGSWSSTGEIVKTSTSGGSQPHNNMPPYIAVYMWKRTA